MALLVRDVSGNGIIPNVGVPYDDLYPSIPVSNFDEEALAEAVGGMEAAVTSTAVAAVLGDAFNTTEGEASLDRRAQRSVRDYRFAGGAKGNSQTNDRTTSIGTGSTTASNTRLQLQGGSPAPSFSAVDIGKTIVVPGAGAAGVDLVTVIDAIVNAGPVAQLTLHDAASTNLLFATKSITYGNDDTLALKAALLYGGMLFLPAGRYMIFDTLLANKPFHLFGEGYGSSIFPVPGYLVGKDAILVKRLTTEGARGFGLSRFRIQTTGLAASMPRYGINVDAADSAWMAQFFAQQLFIDAMSKGSFRLTNPNNPDGLFCSYIDGCLFNGGDEGSIIWESAGDSLQLTKNTMAGNGLGVDADFRAGAARFTMEDNNVTAAGGAVRLNAALQATIRKNQIEQSQTYLASTRATVAACITIGDVTNVSDLSIAENNLNNNTSAATYGVDLVRADNVRIRDNAISKGGSNKHIRIGAATTRVTVGKGQNWGGVPALVDVVAGAVRAYGVQHAFPDASLLNSWIPYDSVNHPVFYSRDEAGLIQLVGGVKSGVITANTNILVLPTGFTPAKNIHLACACSVGGNWTVGVATLLINLGGTVQIIGTPAGTTVIMFGNTTFLGVLD